MELTTGLMLLHWAAPIWNSSLIAECWNQCLQISAIRSLSESLQPWLEKWVRGERKSGKGGEEEEGVRRKEQMRQKYRAWTCKRPVDQMTDMKNCQNGLLLKTSVIRVFFFNLSDCFFYWDWWCNPPLFPTSGLPQGFRCIFSSDAISLYIKSFSACLYSVFLLGHF